MSTQTEPIQPTGVGDDLMVVARIPFRTRARIWVLTRFIPPIFMFIFAIGLLELISVTEVLPAIVTPSPLTVLETMGRQATTSFLWENMWVTLQEGLLGFLIGSAIGISLGVGVGVSTFIARAVYPFVVLIQSMPRVALAPVFVALLGFGQSAKVLTAVAICFFPPLINTIVGLRNFDSDALLLMRSLRASRWQVFRKLLLPGALPMIFGGLKTAMTFAILGAIVGELTAATEGIGSLIDIAAFQLRMDAVYGYILWMSIVSLGIFGFMDWVDKRVVFWRDDARKTRLTDQE
ncbi:MAG: ABC transporter permease subunit [Actinobacteria bacterium]|nr:ABC transporter permease subunit [Actinomycetota bacterium]